MDPRLARALVAWLIQRDTRLGNRVRPLWEQPGGTQPFLVYTQISRSEVENLRGRTGQVTVWVQLDVWAKDHATGASIAGQIKGTGRDPVWSERGLDHHVGEWPDPEAPGDPVIVQFAKRLDGRGGDDGATPQNGTEEGWYRFSADYEITYEG